jgi:glycosyltransferase involved in cell wall biosynthesis
MKILLFIPTLWSIPTEMFNFIQKIKSKHQIQIITTSRLLIHCARNLAVEKTLEGGFDYLLFLDDDNPPEDTNFIDVMVETNRDVVTWVVRLRNRQEDLNITKSVDQDGLLKYENYKSAPKNLIEVWNCWCWCVLIKREVLEKVIEEHPRPFESKYTWYLNTKEWYKELWPKVFGREEILFWDNGGLMLKWRELSEDFLFFERVRELWYKIFCNPKIKCRHLVNSFLEV